MDESTNLMMITAFMEFEDRIDFKRLRATIESRVSSFPRFRKKVARPVSGVGTPTWEMDRHFDIRSHIHRVALPSPGGKAELQEMVSDMMAAPLDPHRPLWQVHLIENFGSGSVVLFRIHHCIADGIALVYVLLAAADREADAPWPEALPHKKKKMSSFDFKWPIAGFIRGVQKFRDTTRRLGQQVFEEFKDSVFEPGRLTEFAKKGTHMPADVGGVLTKLALMPPDPKTAFKGRLGTRKNAVWTDPIPLDSVKSIGHAIRDATVNDVLVSLITGAMRRYLKSRNYPVNTLDLNVLVPVNIRKPGTEVVLGNKFSLIFLTLPVYMEDAVLRLKEVKRRMDAIKNSADAMVNFGLLSTVGFMPPGIAKCLARYFSNKASGILTNVPGPKEPLYFAGSEIKNMMFWVPRAGDVGLGVSIFSYNGKVSVGIAADEGLMPDGEALLEGFEEELKYLVQLVESGDVKEAPLVLHDTYQEMRCKAITREGEQCKKRAVANSQFCSTHQPAEPKRDTRDLADILKELSGH
ncbi:acyltransferase, WS/DGAT/MGAT [delta proteobacterium NaphS2]|nr:acyltransferase, WS/DGAT/MGAT [delta proteobacterium NaphS2]